MSLNKWDARLLDLAKFVSGWSKDPSTQCGAVISNGNKVISLGFNGFPAGVADHKQRYDDRDVKIAMVIHAEENCLLFARQDLTGCTLYVWPMPPCSSCSAKIIQAGIVKVVCPAPTDEQYARWGTGFDLATTMFSEAGVILLQENIGVI